MRDLPAVSSMFRFLGLYPHSDAWAASDYAVQVGFAALGDTFILAMTIIRTRDIRLFLHEIGIERAYFLLLLRDGQFCLASNVPIA